MNSIDLTNLGGFPFEQDTLKFMQDGYGDMFQGIARMVGDKTILSGVEVVGSTVSNGWITYNGEIIKFIGGALGLGVIIQEASQEALFEDGESRPVYKIRTATIGAPATFPFLQLKPANIGVPVGTVLMWSGEVTSIPKGFALCDGTNGTPNLSGKFIAGYDAADSDYNTIGKTGGEKKHQLTIAEMPAHSHPFNPGDQNGQSDNANDRAVMLPGNQNRTTGSTGGDQPHENRPPYFTLAYIIKL